MNASLWAIATIVLAYLTGAIPFGYLIARGVAGIDIRTVGSGNIGATNVGRVLGFRFFVVVFLLDLLKGFLPTYFFPLAVAKLGGIRFADLGVLVALATILGHNFPVYLRFRGGKGVATSLGALLALDWVASVAAAVGFGLSLRISRYVSLSSMLGGLVFLVTYLLRVSHPFHREHLAMTIVTFGLVVLLFARHRKNIGRLQAGTEPKVSFRRSKEQPSGYVTLILLGVLVLIGIGAVLVLRNMSQRTSSLKVGAYELMEVARTSTGHQRADRVTFANEGNLVAVTCPRYNRLVLYRVTDELELTEVQDLELDGQPVAVRATKDRLVVLERPASDARHVKPGWWETFDFQGKSLGKQHLAGMYPDDFAVSPDGRYAYILTSGRAEGDSKRPAPALEVVDLADEAAKPMARLEFAQKGDDPCRISLSASGQVAAITLLGSQEIASVDLADPAQPKLIDRSKLNDEQVPSLSAFGSDSIMMGIGPERSAVLVSKPVTATIPEGWIACALPRVSSLVLYDSKSLRSLGRFPLRAGALNLSMTRPTALDFDPGRGLLAVANRSGGVHLISVRSLNPASENNAEGRQLARSATSTTTK